MCFISTDVHGLELSQPGSMVVKPGEILTLTCKVSGYSVSDNSVSYATGWIRQPAGKALEWIFHIWDNGDTYKNNALTTKFSISRDTLSNSVTLKGQNLQTEDTAVYYCARRPPHGFKSTADMQINPLLTR